MGYTSTYTATYPADTATGSFEIDVTAPPPPAVKGPWRFLYGPVQPAGGAVAEVIQAVSKTVTLRAGADQNHEVSFDIDGRAGIAAGITELENDVIVMFGPDLVFCGRIVPTQDTLTASAHRTTVTAFDYREVLRRRAVLSGDQLSWTSTDVATICWNMIQATQGRPGGKLGISRGHGQSTGINRTHTIKVGDYIGDDITALAQLANGFEWAITPYGMADLRLDIFAPTMGSDNGVVLSYGDNRISSITRSVDPSTFADSVYVTSSGGGGSLTPQYLEAFNIGSHPAGRWDTVTGTQDNTQPTLNDHAAGLLNQLQVVVPSYSIQMYPGAWDGPGWLWLGDTVTVRIDSGRLQVNDSGLRVMEMSFAISADNVETLTLTVGKIPFRLHKEVAKILKRLRYLDTR